MTDPGKPARLVRRPDKGNSINQPPYQHEYPPAGQRPTTPPYPQHPHPYPAQQPPPGWAGHQGAYPYPPPPHLRFRPAGGLALTAGILAAVIALLEVVEAAVAWPASARLEEAARAGTAPIEVITVGDFVVAPFLPLTLAVWIVTALWLNRVRENALALNPHQHHRRSPVWAWLGWLVPIVSLWFPLQVVQDVHRATLPWVYRSRTVLGWWWALWLAYLLTIQIGDRIATGTEPNAALVGTLGFFETLNGAFAVGAVVLWLRIVREVNDDQATVARQPRG